MALPERASRICSIAGSAFALKGSLDSFWQEVAELHFPEHADFTAKRNEAEYASQMYDSTPALFRRDFGNYLGSVLRPKGREWFAGRIRDEESNKQQAVQSWLKERDSNMRSLMYDNKSQFIHASALADHQYVTFGNCVTSIERRADGSGMLYRTWHLKDCAWFENPDGEIDTLFRKFTLRVSQLCGMERSAKWNVPQKIKDRLDKGPNDKVSCIHLAMPCEAYYLGDKPKTSKGWVSVYICDETKDILFEEEVTQFRYSVSRWFRLPGSQYAMSPCTVISQPDARTLQSMTWSIMQAGENAVEPPLIGQSETVLGAVNLFPGGVTWVDKNYDERGGEALRPLNLGKVPELGVSLHGVIRDQLASTWYLNKLFLPEGNAQMTAQEVERRWQEFMRATQPIIEPAEPERNGRVLDATFQIALEAGWLGKIDDMPEEIEGKVVDWTYDNPIEDARKQGVLMEFQQSMEITQQAAAVNPKIGARFDIDRAYTDVMAALAPPDWVKEAGDPEIEQAEQAMVQGAEESAAIEQAGQLADVAQMAAKAMPQGGKQGAA